MKSLYNKFSNDRRVEFAICTEILQDEDTRYVRKYNLHPEGKDYMDYMVTVFDSLKERFAGCDRVEVLPCKRIENGVEFPFIKGSTVHGILKEAISNGDKQKLFQILEDYLSVVTYQDKDSTFTVTDRFAEVFGDASDEWIGEPAIEIADIDMIPSNLIVNEENGKWTIIDYEWTFLCPVPVKYLKFRSLLFWYNECQGYTLASWEELMDFLEVSREEEYQFREWENHFQSFILNGKVPFREINQTLPGRYVDVAEILSYQEINENRENTVVYADYGDGYDEDNGIAYISHAKLGNNSISGKLEIPDGAKRVKFYLSSIFGFGYVAKLTDDKETPVKYRFSGMPINERIHMNLQGFLVIECDVESVKTLEYEIYLYELKEAPEVRAMAQNMISEMKVEKNLRRDAYLTSQRRIQDLTCQVENLTRELEEIKAGRWYRLGQKLMR